MVRSATIPLVLIALLAAAGCLGSPIMEPVRNQTTASASTTTASTTIPQATYPDAPENPTNETVKQAVVAFETARLQNELRDQYELTYFELGYLQPVNVTVLNRSDGGLYVRIDGSYSYGTPDRSADGVPVRSLYHVNETAIRHVNKTT
ncbi:hypothetical protein [Halobacterium salinarum]|uniref:Uncharacterized protein n=4 Tax=Halobacterium salinarum TaxID=2242 RepID=Q9HNY5_HALSA|nr:hypothetical protein [Halobacterium salinarum]AAG20085.1 hypothetical protein VNG_1890H [Halobacterium salinarum NRC-1]MBB6089096.1 hypothetical protein [Halobacterium salinarum]MCF2207313.1 hypothetical protein [Halobacterium salinarum]MDL0119526.1 hypothetical protein [Halobacterium salinarum]MDL0132183.1 hypothetical protein [Halobacterium salinarum]